MATIFTRIIEGELPATFVWKDDRCVAFMSINPIREGHTLVVPRLELDHWIDCPPELRDHLFAVAQEIGRAQQDTFQPARVGLMIAGLEVPHLHLHVIPVDSTRDLDFANAAGSVEPEDLEAAATAIRSSLRRSGGKGLSE